MFSQNKVAKRDVVYFPVSEYKKDRWEFQHPKPSDENFIAILKLNETEMYVKLNTSDARGYRAIVTIIADDMATTLNKKYIFEKKMALRTVLGYVSEAYENEGCHIVQEQIAGNNSLTLTKQGLVQIGTEKEANMLHGHIIARGNPKEAYIGNVKLNGPKPNVMFNMRGDSIGCDLFLMDEKTLQNSDAFHLRVYKKNNELIYRVKDSEYKLKISNEVEQVLALTDLNKNGILDNNLSKLSEQQREACLELVDETEKRGHTKGTEEGNKTKTKWKVGEMQIVATRILENLKVLIKPSSGIEIIATRQPAVKSEPVVNLSLAKK